MAPNSSFSDWSIHWYSFPIQAVYDRDIDGVVARLINGPVVSGDVKIRFKSSSRVSFYYIIHTGFIIAMI